MAFIRWKKNKFGIRQAYLVHSYRDEQGRPRHKTLAYLGKNGQIAAEQISALKERHKDLAVNFESIKPAAPPAPPTDIDQLSDEELAKRLRELRSERGLNRKEITIELMKLGIPSLKLYRQKVPFNLGIYVSLERGWGNIKYQSYMELISTVIPYIRQVLKRSAQ